MTDKDDITPEPPQDNSTNSAAPSAAKSTDKSAVEPAPKTAATQDQSDQPILTQRAAKKAEADKVAKGVSEIGDKAKPAQKLKKGGKRKISKAKQSPGTAAPSGSAPSKTEHIPEPLILDDISVSKTARSKRRKHRSWAPLLVTLLLLAAVGAGGYYGRDHIQQWLASDNSQQQTAQLAMQQQLQSQAQSLQQLQQQLLQQQDQQQSQQQSQQQDQQQNQQYSDAIAQLSQQLQQSSSDNQQQLDQLQRRLTSQGSRLRDLSTTTRDDWLLAEAEYLLRLANQRLLTERSTNNPVALLQTVDTILKDFDDPDLFAVRGQIAEDITALKIATIADREGLYLKLNALNSTVSKLSLVLELEFEQPQPGASENPPAVDSNWTDKVAGNFGSFAESLKDYVRIRQRDKPVEPLLGVEQEQYLRHNLTVMLEQAQLALLREEPQIYRSSLQKCRDWLGRYFRPDQVSRVFAEQLDELEQQTVTSNLPDIAGSLQSLRNYINVWHLRHEGSNAGGQGKTTEGNQP